MNSPKIGNLAKILPTFLKQVTDSQTLLLVSAILIHDKSLQSLVSTKPVTRMYLLYHVDNGSTYTVSSLLQDVMS